MKTLAWEPVGSRVTCDPPPMNTDYDVLVLVSEKDKRHMDEYALPLGYVKGGSIDATINYPATPHSRFISYRKGDTNLIVTSDVEFFNRFMAATKVAKQLNLLKKSDRIALFQAVLYGNYVP